MIEALIVLSSCLAAAVILFAGSVALNYGYPAHLRAKYRPLIRYALAFATIPILAIAGWTAFSYAIDVLGQNALLPLILFVAGSTWVIVMLTYPILSPMLSPSRNQAGDGKDSELVGPTEPLS